MTLGGSAIRSEGSSHPAHDGAHAPFLLGFDEPIRAVILGGRNGIGGEFAKRILNDDLRHQVWLCSRDPDWAGALPSNVAEHRLQLDITSASDWERVSATLSEQGPINCVINASGLLHSGVVSPERTWRSLSPDAMRAVFEVNTFGVGLAIKYLTPLFERRKRGLFASLSARVGSIADNRLGGWYSYRASKAAQNMFLKCAALEAKRLWPDLIFVALQPGTVSSDLSEPFIKRRAAKDIFTPEASVQHLAAVLSTLDASDSGSFFGWDGAEIPW